MNITRDMFGTSMAEVIDLFNKMEVEEDFKEFYREYWQVVEDRVNKENHVLAGDNRRFGLVYETVRGNLTYLIGRTSEMKANYARKVWWFLYV